ncbi:GyrI-like domain-containing protein [Aquimarina sp. M1]
MGECEYDTYCLRKVLKWYVQKINRNDDKINFITIFHDSPSLMKDYRVQQSACIEIPNIERVSQSEISKLKIPAQKYVIGKFVLQENEFEIAWNSLIVWMNERNIVSVDGYRFEKFLDKSIIKESLSYKVEIRIPIK